MNRKEFLADCGDDVLTVVYCDRENAFTGETDIRIISARLATKLERNAYNNSIIGRY